MNPLLLPFLALALLTAYMGYSFWIKRRAPNKKLVAALALTSAALLIREWLKHRRRK